MYVYIYIYYIGVHIYIYIHMCAHIHSLDVLFTRLSCFTYIYMLMYTCT